MQSAITGQGHFREITALCKNKEHRTVTDGQRKSKLQWHGQDKNTGLYAATTRIHVQGCICCHKNTCTGLYAATTRIHVQGCMLQLQEYMYRAVCCDDKNTCTGLYAATTRIHVQGCMLRRQEYMCRAVCCHDKNTRLYAATTSDKFPPLILHRLTALLSDNNKLDTFRPLC